MTGRAVVDAMRASVRDERQRRKFRHVADVGALRRAVRHQLACDLAMGAGWVIGGMLATLQTARKRRRELAGLWEQLDGGAADTLRRYYAEGDDGAAATTMDP